MQASEAAVIVLVVVLALVAAGWMPVWAGRERVASPRDRPEKFGGRAGFGGPPPRDAPRQHRSAPLSHVSTPGREPSGSWLAARGAADLRTDPRVALTSSGQARSVSAMLRGIERDG